MEIVPITLNQKLAWRLSMACGAVALLFVVETFIRVYLNCSQMLAPSSGWGFFTISTQTCGVFGQGLFHGELFNMASTIAVRQVLRVSLVSILCALIFHREVTRHISAMALYLKQVTTQDRPEHFALVESRNPIAELNDIENGLNLIVGRLNRIVDDGSRAAQRERPGERSIEFERMSATCEAVTSILHDVNNGLSVLSNSPAHIERLMDLDRGVNHVTREAVGKVLETHERMVSMMAKLISTQQAMVASLEKKTNFSLLSVIGDAIEIEGMRFVRAGISLRQDQLHDFQIRGHHEIYLSILLNLLKNAREAILSADTAERYVSLSSKLEGDRIVLEIRDSGCGISSDKLELIGTHGFSTKGTGHGYGLAGARRMLTDMGGSIAINSSGVSLGTSVKVKMPAA